LRDRFNDIDTGRFTRKDIYEAPLTEPSSRHKYVYANNNPVNRADPSGFTSSTLQEQQQANVALMILIKLFESLDQIHKPTSMPGLRSPEAIYEFIRDVIPFFGIESENVENGVGSIPYFAAQRGRQGDAGDTGIRREVYERMRGTGENMEQALKELMKEAKQADNGKGDTEKIQRIKREQKEQGKRQSRESKDKKK
jgi:hypothetical protein